MSARTDWIKGQTGWPTFPMGLLLALCTHLLWGMMPVRVPQPVRETQSERLIFWTEEQGRLPWSPTLFSLPSGMGFSGVIPRERDRLVVPDITSRLDLRPRPDIRPLAALPGPDLPEAEPAPRFLPLSPRPWSEPASAGPVRFAWVFELRDRVTDEPLRVQSIRMPPLPAEAAARRFSGVMRLNMHGQVTHLLLDPRGPEDALRAEVLRTLRRVQVPSTGQETDARFELSLQPAEARP